jgi:hypothetical protein
MSKHSRAFAESAFAAAMGLAASASAATTTVTFNGIAPPGEATETGPFTLDGAKFTSPGSYLYIIDPGRYGSAYPDGGFLSWDYGPDDSNTLVISLPAEVYSGSFDFGGLFGPITATLTFNGSTYTIASNNSIAGTAMLDWYGFSSTTPISTVTLVFPDFPNYDALDNFSYTTVPEPAIWAMMIAGFSALGWLLGRSRTPSSDLGRQAPRRLGERPAKTLQTDSELGGSRRAEAPDGSGR